MSSRRLMIGVMILGVTSLLMADQPETDEDSLPHVPLSEFAVKQASVIDLGRQLSRSAQVGVCVEEGRRKGHTFALRDVTLRAVLDRLVAADTQYVWRWDAATKLINIYPKNNAPLGWRIAQLSFKNETIQDVLSSDEFLDLGVHNVRFAHFGGNASWLETKVSLDVGDVTARDVMNQLCAQLGFKARWEAWPRETQPGVTSYVLMIHGYGIEPAARDHDGNRTE